MQATGWTVVLAPVLGLPGILLRHHADCRDVNAQSRKIICASRHSSEMLWRLGAEAWVWIFSFPNILAVGSVGALFYFFMSWFLHSQNRNKNVAWITALQNGYGDLKGRTGTIRSGCVPVIIRDTLPIILPLTVHALSYCQVPARTFRTYFSWSLVSFLCFLLKHFFSSPFYVGA